MFNGNIFNYLNNQQNTQNLSTAGPFTFSARVKGIILDDILYPSYFKLHGEWASIGGILFESVEFPDSTEQISPESFAFPLNSNIKHYPIKNEIVTIIALPDNDINNNTISFKYYYLPPINLWSSTHHNAIPNEIFTEQGEQPSQRKNYDQVLGGSERRNTNEPVEIEFDNGFEEKNNIKPLLPYVGDVIVEGRWGNSFRLGSTNKKGYINPWSSIGDNGDPISIIRNGQTENKKEPWIPTIEDINSDSSSMWFTSTQKIPIKVSSKNYNSYDTPPISPDNYTKPQAIITADRILYNSREDILFSAKKSINLNSDGTLNFDVKEKTIINSPKIFLGGKKVDEPLLLGNKTTKLLSEIFNAVNKLSSALTTLIAAPPGVPYANVNIAAIELNVVLNRTIKNLNDIKSKDVFTK
jgi:hypothetical protein